MKNWHVVVVIIGCIILLIISGAIQYHYAQKQVEELTEKVAEIERQNMVLANELLDIYITVTPTHDLPMMAKAITK